MGTPRISAAQTSRRNHLCIARMRNTMVLLLRSHVRIYQKHYCMFLFPLSYSGQAETLSRFLDVSHRYKTNAPTKSTPAISPTASVSTAYLSTGIDRGTMSERDRLSNNIEDDLSRYESSDGTEILPFTPTPRPAPRLKLERSDLGKDMSFESMINRISRDKSASIPTSKTSAAVGFKTCKGNGVSPIRAGSRNEMPLKLSTAASSQGPEQASSDIRREILSAPPLWPPRASRRRRIQRDLTATAQLRKDLGSPPPMRWPLSEPKTLTWPAPAVFAKRALPSHELSPATPPPDEDQSWKAASRPNTPVQEDNFSSSGSKAGSNSALDPRHQGSKDTKVSPNTLSSKGSISYSRDMTFDPFSSVSPIPDHQSDARSLRTPAPQLPSPQLKGRVEYKDILLSMMKSWRPEKDHQRLEDLIHYEDDNDYRNRVEEIEIVRERKRYEHYARQRKVRKMRAFHIYGTELLFPLDCLKSWVKLQKHLNPRTPFPPEYTAITNESDVLSMTGTLFTQSSQSQESDDDESTAPESSKGKGKM